MKHNVIFQPASENDFDIILKLEAESFNSYDRLDRETLSELFSEFREGFFIIISDGVIAGCAVFLIEDGAGYIESIEITENSRRQGLGRLALEFMIKRLRAMGFKEVNLHVRFDNTAAMTLYEKEGFVKKNIVERFYTDGEPAFLYTGDVENLTKNLRS